MKSNGNEYFHMCKKTKEQQSCLNFFFIGRLFLSCFYPVLFFFVSFLIYFMWHTQMARTVYCGNLPNISLMTQNLLGTEGWGNYVCLSALVPSGNTPTLQPFKCNFPTHPQGSRGGGNK